MVLSALAQRSSARWQATCDLQVESVIYDQEEKKAMIYTTQHLTPAPLPFLTFTFPLITILQFTGADKKVSNFIQLRDLCTTSAMSRCVQLHLNPAL